MYEVGLSQSFKALHVMPDEEGPEGTLHSHNYRFDVVVRSDRLDEHGMVVNLDLLNDALSRTVATVADQNLESIRPPDARAVTVEVLARWAHGEIARAIGLGESSELSVRAWESDDAFGGYAGGPTEDGSNSS